ncbi:MAG: bleomycin resistance protein [Chitinophagaceae bacterium]
MLKKLCAKLPMRNKEQTINYYVNQLDFTLLNDYGDYILLEKDAIEMHFFAFPTLSVTENYGQVYIRTEEIEKFYAHLLAKNVAIHPNGSLTEKPWQMKEFALLDPDNNLLTFGEEI